MLGSPRSRWELVKSLFCLGRAGQFPCAANFVPRRRIWADAAPCKPPRSAISGQSKLQGRWGEDAQAGGGSRREGPKKPRMRPAVRPFAAAAWWERESCRRPMRIARCGRRRSLTSRYGPRRGRRKGTPQPEGGQCRLAQGAYRQRCSSRASFQGGVR
jgi:hypothetical protein